MKYSIYNLDNNSKDFLNLDIQSKVINFNFNTVRKYQNNINFFSTASSKTRSMVKGGGAKPYKQKGTGRARRGTSRSPLKVGGGVVFGPSPRNISININNKTLKYSILNILFSRVEDTIILDYNSDTQYKTKILNNFLSSHSKNFAPIVCCLSPSDTNLTLALRNIKHVSIISPTFLPIEELSIADKIIFTKKSFNFALKYLTGVEDVI